MTINDERSRREFCVQAGEFVALLAVAGISESCAGPTSPSDAAPPLPQITGTLTNGGVIIQVGVDSPLATPGGAAQVQAGNATYLVARTGEESFTAVTAVCTHEGCTVSGFSDGIYVCPCHGSRYNTSGTVVNGPAPRPLRQFATTFTDGVLTIAT